MINNLMNKNQNNKIIKALDKFNFPKNSTFFLHTDLTNYFPDSIKWYEKFLKLYFNKKTQSNTLYSFLKKM